ncbi:MAG: hypothetical protein AB1540_11750 [Bdellovibrionota bacterium]
MAKSKGIEKHDSVVETEAVQTGSELAVVQGGDQAKLSVVKGLTRDRIEEMRNQLALLQEFVAKVMIRGEHYGIIPGTQKPTLLKAGAEFLREAYGFEVRSICVDKKFIPADGEDRERDYVEFTYRVELFQNGVSVGVCEGSCNNYERRYEKLSAFSVMNTIQKMAQKRAYVGAVISATRSSNIFTQDLEDEPELVTKAMATPSQAKLIWARLKNELQLNDFAARDFIAKTVGKMHSRDLTAGDVQTLLDTIDSKVQELKKEATSA